MTDITVAFQAPRAIEVQIAQPQIVVQMGGQQGPAGASSTSSGYLDLPQVAAVALGGHRVVRSTVSGVDYADPAVPGHQAAVLGLTTGAASIGATVQVRTWGAIDEPSWSWTPDAPVYLGPSGTLTQALPTSGFLFVVGWAMTATRLFIRPGSPINLL